MDTLIQSETTSGIITNVIIPALIALFFIALSRPLQKLVSFFTRRMLNAEPGQDDALHALARPLRLFIVFSGLYLALKISPAVSGSAEVWPTVVSVYRSGLILFVAWGLCRLESADGPLINPLVRKIEFNSVLLPFVSKVLKFITVSVALLIIAQEWNFSISGLLAGLGLGGLAFALAAQDMLSNLFAGAVILLDKPFKIGDWIQSDTIEGTVEDINFRSVKIRTFTQAVVTVPNSVIVGKPVTNFSRMGKRRVLFNLSLPFETASEQMKSCSEKIRGFLSGREDVDQETVVVVFESIAASSLNLMVVYFTRNTDWLSYIHVREEVYYRIRQILSKEGIEIAFPTQTIHVKQ